MMKSKCCLLLLVLLGFTSCSVSKFIPEGEYLLDDVVVVNYDKDIDELNMYSYVKQLPNSEWFNFLKVPLYTYALSGTDSTRWINRFLQKMGEPPVIFDEELNERTRENLQLKLQSEGYLRALVDSRKVKEKKRMDVLYFLNAGERYTVSSFRKNIQDSVIASIIEEDSLSSLLYVGMPFSLNVLNNERVRITTLLRNMGYYKFRKEYITFVADTAHHSTGVNLTMNVALYKASSEDSVSLHSPYTLNDIVFVSNTGMIELDALEDYDSIVYKGFPVYFKDKMIVRPSLLVSHTFMERGGLFSDNELEKTYNSFLRLSALKYTNVRFEELPNHRLNSYVMFERSKQRSVSFEIEGTNTAGDLGAAAAVTFSDNNFFKGSELFTIKLRGAYEAISNLEGYTGNNYYEYGAEVSLKFPGFIFPFFNSVYKNKAIVTSQISLQFNSQERPEFERQVLSASWSYNWNNNNGYQHKLDVLDVSYIYVPWISDTFKHDYLDSISNRNSILKYNYENLLITKLGYTFSYNSAQAKKSNSKRTTTAIRINVETSGNLLYLKSNSLNESKNSDGQYTFLNIAFAQYVKGDIDVSVNFAIDKRNALVFHVGIGAAYPYGNSVILPFEKRYFSGGANSLRGWSVRGLGPGSYSSSDRKIDFINQSGDLKLDVNLEYRTHLFWKINTAAFIDAGNIWTIRSYNEQPGGQFVLNSFYNEIACSYGLGIRLELGFFVFRLDGGMKAINPAYTGKDKYPLLRPDFGRDFALHFAVGYPF